MRAAFVFTYAPACGLRPSQAKPAPLLCSGLRPPPVAGKARSSPMLRPAASARRRQSPLLLYRGFPECCTGRDRHRSSRLTFRVFQLLRAYLEQVEDIAERHLRLQRRDELDDSSPKEPLQRRHPLTGRRERQSIQHGGPCPLELVAAGKEPGV